MPAHRSCRVVSLLGLLLFGAGCGGDGFDPLTPDVPPENAEPELPSTSILPDALDPVLTARLSKRWETKHFIFHFEPSDDTCCEAMRMEAFHKWAVSYLGISMPKKIDYYKFKSADDLEAALSNGRRPWGVAFPDDIALATWLPWHNHEAFHIYNRLFIGGRTIRLFDEGMVVSHEFDPMNGEWVARQTRHDPHGEPYIERVRWLRANDFLFPIESILESQAFNAAKEAEELPVAYPEAGMFVAFLIDQYGLEKMKAVMQSVGYGDSLEWIRIHFQQVFSVSVQEAEAAWLAWLDGMLQ